MRAQLEYTADELLATDERLEPLFAAGVRCHGGFDEDGRYVSPRMRYRATAIKAWETNRMATFGTELLDIRLERWPGHYPNVAQSKLLLRRGVREPMISTLTRIGTVEGFGAMLRHSPIPNLGRMIDDDLRGTAAAHLGTGLYEAHARDEAGFEDEGGHKQMWFAARDVAFENPVTVDETDLMLQRMGLPTGAGADPAALRAAAKAGRLLPDDIDFDLESLVNRMVRLLLIEISAFHGFAWAEEVLADDSLVAGEGEAARLISFVRADETPHVSYLRTVLSELRDRSWIGDSGRHYAGTDMVGTLWDAAVAASVAAAGNESRTVQLREIEYALGDRTDRDGLLEEFHTLGDVRPDRANTWVEAVT